MGRRLASGAPRQHADLSGRIPDWARPVILAVLAFDGVLSAVLGALMLPLYVGTIPVPISALFSGLMNAALIWAALQWTAAPRVAALPLWTWLATVTGLTLGGPGGDIVFGGAGIMEFSPLIFVVVGAAPPAYVLWRHLHPRA
ncbi:hypothetical protein CIW52_24390 [Mycolicibacterium sp. P9-64]|uniref:hypothetical protein n=1 Tax=Mycolicibacterium sp. P9-64 TaxID=2024612 RepID=UPI0011F06E02|nr:hypothetical protein [Mycolicibacterium sp. P9-64]KAA0080715.1 hypothetical protein CIW52_24390 [Mycolicibacterium sp. P9-64]